MKYILDARNGGKRYAFNLYTVHEYADGTVSEDARVVEGDNLEEFVAELCSRLKNEDVDRQVNQEVG